MILKVHSECARHSHGGLLITGQWASPHCGKPLVSMKQSSREGSDLEKIIFLQTLTSGAVRDGVEMFLWSGDSLALYW